MKTPTIPKNEKDRLAALQSYYIPYTKKEEEYDQITDLATHITGMPISLISLVAEKKVWFKSTKGIDICSSDRDLSFCSYALANEENTFVVNNTLNHSDFKNHPYATQEKDPIVFYAGICLVDVSGQKLGTLCVIDSKANELSKKQLDSLEKLAKQVVKLIELHKATHVLENSKRDLEAKNKELKNFAGVVSHDMKMPLANIILTADILKAKYATQLDKTALGHLAYLKQSSFTLSDYITGLLNHYEIDSLSEQTKEIFDIHHLLEEIVEQLKINIECQINFPEKNIEIKCNRAALEQILLNLMSNSLKYNDKNEIIIDIEAEHLNDTYFFKVTDNGMGIPEAEQKQIFDLFSIAGNLDRNGLKGSGIGLSTVKKLVTNFGGQITVSSTPGMGSSFEFTIKD
jgi:signal transduction histidine kinase